MVHVPVDPTSPADRIAPRHLFEARIRIRWQRENQKLAAQGWTRDLSESGLSAFVADLLIVGELISLEVPLSTAERMVIPAKVARSRGTEYGFQFTALSFAQRKEIQAILRGQPEIPFSSR
ncbi:MAG: PilZ domain-containing protein [Acidobacteria bacterium]|nr:PilZ domain-containing protein [Acidobacteriota bacterium]